MSKTDPKCYPVGDSSHWRGSKSDRSPSLHEMVDSWNRLETFDFRACQRGEDTDRGGFQRAQEAATCFRFMPERSTVFSRAEKAAKRAHKREQREQREAEHARHDHEINRILSACAPFPITKTSD